MKRTQVQIPEPLYAEVRRIAEAKEWSISEVFRRAAEQFVAESPSGAVGWEFPEPRRMGKAKITSDRWRELVADDEGQM